MGQLAVVLAPGTGELGVEQVVVLGEEAGLLLGQAEHGVALYEEARVPVVPGHHGQLLGIGPGDGDAACAVLLALLDVFDDGVGRADDEVARLDLIGLPVESQGGRAARAERHDDGFNPYGLLWIEVGRIFDEGNHAVVVVYARYGRGVVEGFGRNGIFHRRGVRRQRYGKAGHRKWL